MNSFKEWLSDYLRYFMLALAAFLVFGLAMIGVRIYQNAAGGSSQNSIVGDTEQPAETEVETETETESETISETESETESEASSETETGSETETAASASAESSPGRESGSGEAAAASAPMGSGTGTESAAEAEPESESETETETEYVYEPVYKTLVGSCYLRSGPSMEAEIIGEYMYGTTVEFLEDVGGWYKVQIDGMVGYMGARFF